jgi:hypothetical protein
MKASRNQSTQLGAGTFVCHGFGVRDKAVSSPGQKEDLTQRREDAKEEEKGTLIFANRH